MSTQLIVNSTNTSPFEYPGNTRMDIQNNVILYCLVPATTANTYNVYYLAAPYTATWTLFQTTTRANVVDIGSIFITGQNDNWMYWCYRTNESSQDRLYVRRLNMYNQVWDAEILVDAVANGGVAGAVYGGMDMHLVIYGGQVILVIAAGITVGSQIGVSLRGVYWSTSSVPWVTQNIVPGNAQWLYTGSGRIQPSVDIEHNGDGKASAAPHLWVAFGRQRLQMVKMAWHGGGWSGPVAAQELVATGMPARDYTSARWDGGAFMIAVPNTSPTDTVLLLERNQANTSTIVRTSPPLTTGAIRHVSLSYNRVTRDCRVYAVGTTTAVLYYIDFVRATGLWTSWATVSGTPVIGTSGEEWGVRRGSVGDAKHDVYAAHTAGVLNHYSQTLAYAPFTPTWVTQTGQAADVATGLLLSWLFSDSDPGDTQSAYAISRQIGAGALAYWRASDASWQPAEVQNTSGSSTQSIPSGWGTDPDAAHTYRVKVWDQSSTASGYSDALTVIASAVVNPVIVAPTANQVLTGDTATVTWTAAQQTQYRVMLSTAGAFDKFGRTVGSGSWGTADSANTWGGASTEWSVTAGQGRATHATSTIVQNTLSGLAAVADVSVLATIHIGQKLTGSGAMYPSVLLRRGGANDYYQLGVYYQASAVATGAVGVVIQKVVAGVNTGLFSNFSFDVYDGSESFFLRAEAIGSVIRFKVWRTTGAEPVAWTASVTDSTFTSGGVGVFSSRDAGVTNVSPFVTFDDVAVSVLPVLDDSGWRAGTTATYTPPVTLVNGNAYETTVQTRNLEGLPSSPQFQMFSVTFLAPDTPTNVNTAVPASGWISVAIANPGPTGGRPVVASNDIYRRPVGDTTNGVRVASNIAVAGTYRDWQAVDGIAYEYRVLANGVNGTSQFGAWTT